MIQIGTSTAFICGRKTHECNSKGHIVYGLSDGFEGDLWAICYRYNINPGFCERDVLDILQSRDITITMMSVSCSICNKPAIHDNSIIF